jgi:hypothetical protein
LIDGRLAKQSASLEPPVWSAFGSSLKRFVGFLGSGASRRRPQRQIDAGESREVPAAIKDSAAKKIAK